MNFQRICYKNCRVAFRLVFQFTANHLGSRKSANIHSHRLLVFAPTVFLFWSCNLVRIIYTWLTKSVFTAYIGLSLVVGDIDYFLPSKLSVSKYTAYHWRNQKLFSDCRNCEAYKVDTWYTRGQWVDVPCIPQSGCCFSFVLYFFLSNVQTFKIFTTLFSGTVRPKMFKLGTLVDNWWLYRVY